MPGKKYASIKRPKVYEALRRGGMAKSMAAAISNKGATKAGRKAMARKATKTRKSRSRKR